MNPTKHFRNLGFHVILEKEVNDIGYGQLTFNCVIKDGAVLTKTIKVTRSKKKNYPIKQGVTIGLQRIVIEKDLTMR